MKLHALSCGRLRMKRRIYFPDAQPEETIELPVASYLIRHAQGTVLFDTGCHPLALREPEARWGALGRSMVPISAPGDNLIESLRALGHAPADIDVVICSHLHPDHCGCNAFFTRASVICHADEMKAARAADARTSGYFAADWDHPQAFDLIAGERDVFGDGRVVVVPLPGHTVGTVGALVALDRSGTFLLASDALSLRATLDLELTPRNTWNAEIMHRSLAEIRRIEASGASVICGHDAEQWRGLKKGADAYE